MTHKDTQELEGMIFALWVTCCIIGIGVVYLLEQIHNELRKRK